MRNPVNWLLRTVKPWLWAPYADARYEPWYWALAVMPFVDWAEGFHFDGLGVWLRLGPWSLELGLRDND